MVVHGNPSRTTITENSPPKDQLQYRRSLVSVFVALTRMISLLLITKTRLFKYTGTFTTKNENFQIKNSDIFHIPAQNIDWGYSLEPPHRGGSNEYPQSMFLSINKKNNVYRCKPHFYYINVGFKESKLCRHVFVMYRRHYENVHLNRLRILPS